VKGKMPSNLPKRLKCRDCPFLYQYPWNLDNGYCVLQLQNSRLIVVPKSTVKKENPRKNLYEMKIVNVNSPCDVPEKSIPRLLHQIDDSICTKPDPKRRME